ncbi:methylmalonyl-CoA mutase small subunit [Ornithinimicrobium sp. LYQ92]|uniref:methylmalonyl-CoA mutase small subunit n=1 Tax=Serinicoccus sp. LYQ92 TaxID=3378798 RepID=UPI003853FD8E
MEESIQPAEAVVEAMPEVLRLGADFPAPTREQWEAQVARTLNRRRPPDRQLDLEQCLESLRTRTVDGLRIEPLYERDERTLGMPGEAPFRRGLSVGSGQMDAWDVRALHDDPDAGAGHDAVLTDLERGATSIWVKVGSGAVAPGDLAQVLGGVELDLAPVVVSSEDDQVGAARALLEVCRERGGRGVAGNLGLDPIGLAAVTGTAVDLSPVAELTRETGAEHPGMRALTVDAGVFHDAGAADVDELAFALATGVDYLRALEAAGVAPAQGVGQIDFRVSAGADQFLTIARLRALRQLWARVGEACGVPAEHRGARQHAVTSWRMLTRDDPWVNMLRVTTATFAAVAGGAEAVTVLPFDHVHGYPDAFSRRVARNTQVVLAEESNIGRVTDPAGGSWYVESLTDQLAERAWELFQRLEAEGGMARALTGSTLVSDTLAASRAERADRIAHRSAAITGVSTFPAAPAPPLPRTPRPEPAGGGLPRVRDAAVFEALHDRAAGAEGARVFLATLGLRRDYGARETFASGLLAAAGIATTATESTDPAEQADGFTASGSMVALLCSSPALYAEHGPAVARALRQAGARKVLLAGSAHELGDAEEQTLVDGTVRTGMDAVAFLDDLLDTLEVPR